jgi:hypothetical protein
LAGKKTIKFTFFNQSLCRVSPIVVFRCYNKAQSGGRLIPIDCEYFRAHTPQNRMGGFSRLYQHGSAFPFTYGFIKFVGVFVSKRNNIEVFSGF